MAELGTAATVDAERPAGGLADCAAAVDPMDPPAVIVTGGDGVRAAGRRRQVVEADLDARAQDAGVNGPVGFVEQPEAVTGGAGHRLPGEGHDGGGAVEDGAGRWR